MTTEQTIALIVGGLIALLAIVVLIRKFRQSGSAELPWEDRDTITGGPEVDADAPPTIDSTGTDAPEIDGGESVLIDGTGHAGTGAVLETPESIPSRLQRLRSRLARSGGLGQALLSILSRSDLSARDWEEIEETLLMADVGMDATTELMDTLKTEIKIAGDPGQAHQILRRELLKLVDPTMDRSLHLDGEPATLLMVGVNGTGKTTTVGKLARILVAEDKTVLLGAADTFRAAAADQLETWGERVGVDVVRSDREGADPASVAFEAVAQGKDKGVDVVMVDTAGRLQNKAGLMDELGKIKRVMEREHPVNEVLLVLDATTGQNGMRQAQVFAEVAGITGIVLTKLDGTAKGGIVISVQRELGVPVKFVGLGEGADDLAPFSPEDFVDSILS